MTETRKRIKAYQQALPALRERVVAVALLMVMSLAMMVSASFAWVTLSISPELTGVSTTITANGNLEIALVNKEGTQPEESAVGDSSSVAGQSVTDANLTWGNLVNLSDPSYGLDHLTLRPALLGNNSQLLEKPLKGVDYGSDGRTELYYNENYAYTSWYIPDVSTGLDPYFAYYETPKYGVRAISTTQVAYKNPGYQRFMELYSLVTGTHGSVGDQYDAMLANTKYINALADLIGVFMTDKLNEKDSDVSNDTIEACYLLMKEFEGIIEDFKEPLMHLANAQVFNTLGMEYYESSSYKDVDAVMEAYNKGGLSPSLRAVIKEYLRIQGEVATALYGTDVVTDDGTTHTNGVADFYNQIKANANDRVKMTELSSIINSLVDINSCKIICNGTTYTVGGIGMSAATKLLGNDVDAIITKGTLKDFEQLTGYTMCATNVTVKATYIITVEMTAKTITTAAATSTTPYLFVKEQENTKTDQDGNMGDATITAEDTYGMALDFWVRTNAENAYLNLEGNILTKEDAVRATGIDLDGESVELWTVNITVPAEAEGEEDYVYSLAVYKDTLTAEDGTTTTILRDANNHSQICTLDSNGVVVQADGKTISEPVPRVDTVVEIIGYEGENRVWEENALLDTTSTTQGGGSCYVFYSDDPAQQLSSLQLLSNLRVAFVDATEGSSTYGKKVAVAYLDTENYYAVDGKFTVPLKLVNDGSAYLTYDSSNDLAILPMVRNQAMRLTAIVYLDGQSITNAQVLAANEIQGRLNIQFGSSVDMETMGDDVLETATRTINAQAKKATDSSYGTGVIEFSFDDATEANPMKVDVAVTVDGDTPSTVTAFFMRKINDTQGSREDKFELTLDETTGKYVGSYTFKSPGNYVLRTVQLDGSDYDLPANDYPQVKISGFNIESVTCDRAMIENAVTIMTGDKSVRTEVTLKFSSDAKKTPSNVYLQFEDEQGNLITANLSLDSSTQVWSGSANFTSSGVYTLKYAVIDGEYTELDARFKRTLTIYLGMSVRIRDTGEFNDVVYNGQSQTVPVFVDIYDNTGAEMTHLQDVKLYYDRAGSILNGLDPDLSWNSSQDCYTGNLQIAEPGYYTFNRVVVGSSGLTTTTEVPPTYLFTNPNPPEVVSLTMPDQKYIITRSGDEDQFIALRMNEAQSARVCIELYDSDTNSTVRLGVTTNDDGSETWQKVSYNDTNSVFMFSLKDGDQLMLGNWTVKRVFVANVYEENGGVLNYYNEAEPMVFSFDSTEDDTTDKEHPLAEENRQVQIVRVKVAVTGVSQTISTKTVTADDGSESEVNLTFLESAYTTNKIAIKITDHKDRKLTGTVVAPVVRYSHDFSTTQKNGGYTSAILNGDGEGELDSYTATIEDETTYTLNNIKLTYAGVYKPLDLVFSVDGDKYEYGSNIGSGWGDIKLPEYTLQTVVPTVTITAISPTGTYSIDTNTVGQLEDSSHSEENSSRKTRYYFTINTDHVTTIANTSYIPTKTGTVANVYYKCTHNDTSPYGYTSYYRLPSTAWLAALDNVRYHEYIQPTVTITLANKGNAANATLGFVDSSGTAAHIYAENKGTTKSDYTWTADGAKTMYIGLYTDNSYDDDAKTVAGTVTATVLTLKDNAGNVYTVDIADMTINNPY